MNRFKNVNSIVLLIGCVCWVLLAGCGNSTSSESVASTEKKLPKLPFHRPKTGQQAISRMQELVQGISSENDLPAPLHFKVREVIHGSGPSGHSHYYLIKAGGEDHAEDHQDDHHSGESSEKRHEIEVDAFTELYDISRWLPKVASNSDIGQPQWQAIKQVSDEMVAGLSGLASDQNTVDQKRNIVRSQSKQFAGWWEQLTANFPSSP